MAAPLGRSQQQSTRIAPTLSIGAPNLLALDGKTEPIDDAEGVAPPVDLAGCGQSEGSPHVGDHLSGASAMSARPPLDPTKVLDCRYDGMAGRRRHSRSRFNRAGRNRRTCG